MVKEKPSPSDWASFLPWCFDLLILSLCVIRENYIPRLNSAVNGTLNIVNNSLEFKLRAPQFLPVGEVLAREVKLSTFVHIGPAAFLMDVDDEFSVIDAVLVYHISAFQYERIVCKDYSTS